MTVAAVQWHAALRAAEEEAEAGGDGEALDLLQDPEGTEDIAVRRGVPTDADVTYVLAFPDGSAAVVICRSAHDAMPVHADDVTPYATVAAALAAAEVIPHACSSRAAHLASTPSVAHFAREDRAAALARYEAQGGWLIDDGDRLFHTDDEGTAADLLLPLVGEDRVAAERAVRHPECEATIVLDRNTARRLADVGLTLQGRDDRGVTLVEKTGTTTTHARIAADDAAAVRERIAAGDLALDQIGVEYSIKTVEIARVLRVYYSDARGQSTSALQTAWVRIAELPAGTVEVRSSNIACAVLTDLRAVYDLFCRPFAPVWLANEGSALIEVCLQCFGFKPPRPY